MYWNLLKDLVVKGRVGYNNVSIRAGNIKINMVG